MFLFTLVYVALLDLPMLFFLSMAGDELILEDSMAALGVEVPNPSDLNPKGMNASYWVHFVSQLIGLVCAYICLCVSLFVKPKDKQKFILKMQAGVSAVLVAITAMSGGAFIKMVSEVYMDPALGTVHPSYGGGVYALLFLSALTFFGDVIHRLRGKKDGSDYAPVSTETLF